MPAIYLFIFIGPELFIELISAGPVGKFDNRSIDELFPMLIEDQNITTVFDFEVTVRTSEAISSIVKWQKISIHKYEKMAFELLIMEKLLPFEPHLAIL